MLDIPNIGGTSPIPAKMEARMKGIRIRRSPRVFPIMKKQKSYVEAVDLLITDYNDKAFIYNTGKVDIVKDGNLKTVKFKNKKDAALYLMKTGWKYV